MTLSRFLRDYIYIPLGGNRKGEISTYINIMITFLIGGFWHGAGWTFIIWGGIHGAALCIQRSWQKLNIKIPKLLAIFITFNIVNIAWIFFRAKSIQDALNVCKAMIGMNAIYGLPATRGLDRIDHALALLIALISVFTIFALKNSNTVLQQFKPSIRMIMATAALIVISLLFLNSTIPKGFIYNDF
jgi:D-alanyl-lipoteichoic acid acyltransferase DltB (MBOAT superfamily)